MLGIMDRNAIDATGDLVHIIRSSKEIQHPSRVIYLDHNATTPVLPEVLEAMKPYFTERWGNPSSSYRFGSELKGVIETARGQVARLIGARTSEIIFTGNATESNNAAIHAALRANPGKRHIITSQVEHSSVLNYCMALEKDGYRVTYLSVDREGLLNIADLENAITDNTAVVSLMWANNETGVLFPVVDIARVCREKGVLFHCDSVQAVGKLAVDVGTLPVDYLSFAGHKLGAPKGVGALYVRRKVAFSPLLYGGHQERGLRGGTECVPLIVGFGCAAEVALKHLPEYESTVRPLRDALENGVLNLISNTELNGHQTKRLSNTVNIQIGGVNSDALLMLLDREGVCASSGSACLADSTDASHVIASMKPETRGERNSLRLSLGLEHDAQTVNEAFRIIARSVSGLRSM